MDGARFVPFFKAASPLSRRGRSAQYSIMARIRISRIDKIDIITISCFSPTALPTIDHTDIPETIKTQDNKPATADDIERKGLTGYIEPFGFYRDVAGVQFGDGNCLYRFIGNIIAYVLSAAFGIQIF